MILADFLPEEEKLARFLASYKTGSIFFLYASSIHDPKDKYFLVLVAEDTTTLFIINSKIPTIIRRNPRWEACQVLIEENFHPDIVEHDCYIDCTFPFSLKQVIVKTAILGNMKRIKGTLNRETLERVKIAVDKDIRMSFSEKMPILNALRATLTSQ